MDDISLQVRDEYLNEDEQAIYRVVADGPDEFVISVEDRQRKLRDDRLCLSADEDVNEADFKENLISQAQ